MNNKDENLPDIIPWSEYEELVLATLRDALASRGELTAEIRTRLAQVFGPGNSFDYILIVRPARCARCKQLHRTFAKHCYKCDRELMLERRDAAVRAQVLAEIQGQAVGK